MKQMLSENLLSKFIESKTTPEETEEVLSWLNESAENLQEFLEVRQSLLEDRSENYKLISNTESRNRRWMYGAISAAAVLIAAVLFIVFYKPSSPSQVLTLAENTKTDTASIITTNPVPQAELLSEHQEKQTESSKTQNAHQVYVAEQETYLSKAQDMDYLTMIKPRRTEQSIVCGDLDKTFTFLWSTNAVSAQLIVKDKHHQIILDKEFTSEKEFEVPLKDLFDYGEVFWTVKVTYQNKKTSERSGKLNFKSGYNGTWHVL